MEAIKNRYDFVMLFDVENGNPNGDPDAGNMPRIDPETSHGLVTDVCIKRKIRNYVEAVKDGTNEKGYCILINPDKPLNNVLRDARKKTKKSGDKRKQISDAKEYMCENYYDVRTFGAVMSMGGKNDPTVSCGTVRGPVQINFAKSIDPIYPMELTIIRQAVTKEEDFEEKDHEMGKKNIVPYALYRAEGYVSALLAQKTGFSDSDLELLWGAIINMFEIDHSAARGKMCLRKLVVFKHDNALGNCPSDMLFEKIDIKKNCGDEPARSFKDYTVTIGSEMPQGVTLEVKL